jgi:hypothetical protein
MGADRAVDAPVMVNDVLLGLVAGNVCVGHLISQTPHPMQVSVMK